MKIVHVCLNCFYADGFEYQENVLPRKHRQLGFDVTIISSVSAFTDGGKPLERKVGDYLNCDGIPVKIIPYNTQQRILRSTSRLKQFGCYSGLEQALDDLCPDIIFVHGMHFLSMIDVVRHKKRHPDVKIFADQHGDYVNSPIVTWKQKLLSYVFWRAFSRMIAKYIEVIWGVTPDRVRYLKEVYGVPQTKVGLLVMGGDEDKIIFNKQAEIRQRLRRQYGIADEDFLVISGGKIDAKKNIHLLMQAVANIDSPTLKLVVFGDAIDDAMEDVLEQNLHDNIHLIGWIPSACAYEWFLTSDLAVFPGTHSVLWEQAIACGTPCLFKKWDGMEHLNVGGNCEFLYESSVQEIQTFLEELIADKERYTLMKEAAITKGVKAFTYSEIAKRSILYDGKKTS